MAFLEWSSQYVMGYDQVDTQHRHLFQLVNDLHDAVTVGAERSTLSGILDELIDYTVLHFGTEESLFATHDYPEKDAHKREHDDLARQAVDLKTKFEEGIATISFEVLDFLSVWLRDHTLRSDMNFVKFIKSKAQA